MIGGAVHCANAVKSSWKTRSDSDRQKTISITTIVDTLESHKSIGFGTTQKLATIIRGIKSYGGEYG